MKLPINVVVSGEAGAGKSSVINLIARKEVAPVASNLYVCTTECTRYDISFDDIDFVIFDTIGLEDPQMGADGYLDPIEKIHELIVNLGATGGVHLLLFCIRAGQLTGTTLAHYQLLCEVFCNNKVPIALVFTGLEGEVMMEDWWQRNVKHIEHYGIRSDGHACVTAVLDDFVGEDLKFTESQRIVRELLKACTLLNNAFPELLLSFARLGCGLRGFIEKHGNPGREDVVQVLTHRCKLDLVTAETIAGMMEKGDPEDWDRGTGYILSSGKSPTTNVVLFGERGIGKSLIINLIAQKEIAQVLSDVKGRTMQSTRYDISFEDMNFAIFDTVGLEEPQMGVNGYLSAIEKAYEFIVKLGAAGGIHLVLFCVRRGGVTATTQSNYRLFRNFLSGTKIPMVLVFTGPEREVEMKDWWVRNKTHMEHYGIGQVCIPVRSIQDREYLNHTESQKKLRELLKVCVLQNEVVLPEPDSWFARFGKGMKSFIAKQRVSRDVMRVLTDRCNLDPETARKIASMIEQAHEDEGRERGTVQLDE